MAEHIIVDHGDTTRWEPGQVMRPSAPSPEPTWDGPRTRGWRVTGQAHRLRVEQLFLGPRRRAVDEREAIDIPVRTAKRTLARRAKAALTANPDAPERPAGGVPAGPGHRRRRNRAQPPRGRQLWNSAWRTLAMSTSRPLKNAKRASKPSASTAAACRAGAPMPFRGAYAMRRSGARHAPAGNRRVAEGREHYDDESSA